MIKYSVKLWKWNNRPEIVAVPWQHKEVDITHTEGGFHAQDKHLEATDS